MNIIMKIFFFVSAFIIFWSMIGYPLSLKIISKILKVKEIKKDYTHMPSVTVMIVAHNEEKVIKNKLINVIELEYKKDKIKFLVASDNSTDNTNSIVKEFIKEHKDYDISLYEVKERKGKTNAQNEAQKSITTEYLVMTDANSIMEKNSVVELLAAFTSDNIAYVTGKLSILNKKTNDVSSAEATYWDNDLVIRDIESKIQTITAGNGALYACRTKDYYDFDSIKCHDSSMPLYYALNGKRAISNHDAIAYEKAGESIRDEFNRKVRMNRIILQAIIPDIRILNVVKYKWFSYFYFGHRTCRYLLWISHLLIFLFSALLMKGSLFYLVMFLGQLLFFALALIRIITKSKNRVLLLIYYYSITIIAQWVAVLKILTGKAKPFWEKAETTR
ncbi:MAG: glycosyltransferase [Bacilli bacterium]|nr:glycosyltransferase [Candidatus Cloacimonadota bacterium]MDD4027942.1 glycosyltransferase [Bacilli bacterium]